MKKLSILLIIVLAFISCNDERGYTYSPDKKEYIYKPRVERDYEVDSLKEAFYKAKIDRHEQDLKNYLLQNDQKKKKDYYENLIIELRLKAELELDSVARAAKKEYMIRKDKEAKELIKKIKAQIDSANSIKK